MTETNESELTKEELAERVAIIKKFKSILIEERKKLRDYLSVLEKEEVSIETENTDALKTHTDIGEEVISSLRNLEKVAVPFYKLYSERVGKSKDSETHALSELEKDLGTLKEKVSIQNEKNRELLKLHLGAIHKRLENFKNPYRNITSIYAKRSAEGSLVALEV